MRATAAALQASPLAPGRAGCDPPAAHPSLEGEGLSQGSTGPCLVLLQTFFCALSTGGCITLGLPMLWGAGPCPIWGLSGLERACLAWGALVVCGVSWPLGASRAGHGEWSLVLLR